MNLVQEIMDQLSGGAAGQLGSLLGMDAETTERATSAAVPSLLSALLEMTSNDKGAGKLASVLGSFDTNSLGSISQLLGGNASSALSSGTSLLGSLFGDSMTSGLASTLSRITGLNSGIVKNLLAYLMPLVIGKVAAHWKNQGATIQGLKSLFAGQRDNIANAVPPGFSLADIRDASDFRQPTYSSTHAKDREPVAAGSPASWILPLALVLVGGFLLWQFLSRPKAERVAADNAATSVDQVTVMKPVVPDSIDIPSPAKLGEDINGIFKSLDSTFTSIRDAASAKRALPALKELNVKIDALGQLLSRLPEASRTALRPALESRVKDASEKANAVRSIDGIGTEIKELIQEIVAKLTKWISA